MTKNIPPTPPSGLGIGDIAYVLFKHKWKIILISLVGLAVAASYHLSAPPLYSSQAKLMVRYVVDRSGVDQVEGATPTSLGRPGDSVIQSELEILTSWDLAEEVGGLPGMERLAPKSKGPVTPATAAGVIAAGLKVSAVKGSNVILVSFMHQDPELAQKVLDELVRQYFIKHLDIHRSKEAAKFVTDKVEKSRTKLRGAEDELTKLKSESGILSLPEAMITLNTGVAKAQSNLSAAESQLAEQRARVTALERFASGGDGTQSASPTSIPTKSTDPVSAEGIAKSAASAGATAAAIPAAPAEATEPLRIAPSPSQRDVARSEFEYLNAISALRILESERLQMLKIYRKEHEAIKELDMKIARQQSIIEICRQQSMEESNRRLRTDLQTERAQLAALEAKREKLLETLAAAQKNASAFAMIMPRIAEKELARDIEQGNYKYMAASLEKAEIDEALDGSKMPNISIVQEATPAALDVKRRHQIAMGIAGGAPAVAIALILLFGLILKKTINRPQELENRLGIPLLLSIPFFNRHDRLRLSHSKGENGSNGHGSKELMVKAKPHTAPWETGHFIRPYSEAIRDRLGLYFEVRGITHKPKLIGVTSVSAGAGTSTLAAGLAAALSNTGDGKVLLVDMSGSDGNVHPFFAGRPAVPLDVALKPTGEIQSTVDNLYLATAERNSPGSGSLGLNKFRRIVRDLEGSDFDYMVFDMPSMAQTSPAAALAGLMDQVLVIVESESSSPEEVKRSCRDLVDSRATFSLIFNKARSHGPKALVGQI